MNTDFIKQYRDLWAEIFNDNPEFVDKYFSIFLNENTFHYVAQSERLISALIACDYGLLWNKNNLKFAYLSGILTDSNFRERGFCSKLIADTFNTLYKKQYPLCGLIAADDNLVNYYKKFGFIQCKNTDDDIFKFSDITPELLSKYTFKQSLDITDNRLLTAFFTQENSVRHNQNTLQLYNGADYLRFGVTLNDDFLSIAVGRQMNGVIELLYLQSVNSESQNALLSSIADKYKTDILIAGTKNSMIRAVNIEKLLNIYAMNQPHKTLLLQIEDGFIEENNAVFEINSGKVRRTDKVSGAMKMTAQDLTEKCFADTKFCLMLDR